MGEKVVREVGRVDWVSLKIAQYDDFEIRICGFERGDESIKFGFERDARCGIRFVGLLVGIGIDEGNVGGWRGSKNDRLKATFVNDFVGGTVVWHEGGLFDDGDGVVVRKCCISC